MLSVLLKVNRPKYKTVSRDRKILTASRWNRCLQLLNRMMCQHECGTGFHESQLHDKFQTVVKMKMEFKVYTTDHQNVRFKQKCSDINVPKRSVLSLVPVVIPLWNVAIICRKTVHQFEFLILIYSFILMYLNFDIRHLKCNELPFPQTSWMHSYNVWKRHFLKSWLNNLFSVRNKESLN